MSKQVTCKRCGQANLSWIMTSRWTLYDDAINAVHECPVREVKEVKCKYCSASDLWWSKEKMEDGSIKNVLMESYGLPHGCDERRKHFDAISQAKKDEYAKEKARIEAIPNGGACPVCIHGILPGIHFSNYAGSLRCRACDGSGRITAQVKKRMLYRIRQQIWPNIGKRQ